MGTAGIPLLFFPTRGTHSSQAAQPPGISTPHHQMPTLGLMLSRQPRGVRRMQTPDAGGSHRWRHPGWIQTPEQPGSPPAPPPHTCGGGGAVLLGSPGHRGMAGNRNGFLSLPSTSSPGTGAYKEGISRGALSWLPKSGGGDGCPVEAREGRAGATRRGDTHGAGSVPAGGHRGRGGGWRAQQEGGRSHVREHACGSVQGCRCRQPGIELVPFSAFQMIFHLCN